MICGRGKADGVEIQADHIKPKELDGKAEIENGQTLCAQHNFQKKYYKQTETGKRMFIRLYELTKKNNDKELTVFCEQVLKVYEKNNKWAHCLEKINHYATPTNELYDYCEMSPLMDVLYCSLCSLD